MAESEGLEKIKRAFEKADLKELAIKMIDMIDNYGAHSALIYDSNEEKFDVIAQFIPASIRDRILDTTYSSLGLHRVARLKDGYNNLVETDKVLEKFFDDLPLGRIKEIIIELVKSAKNTAEISEIMLETTGYDYNYYKRQALICSVQEWIKNEIVDLIEIIRCTLYNY